MYLKCGVVGGVHRVHRHLAALPAVQAVQLRQHDEGHHLVDDYDLKVKTIIAPLFSLGIIFYVIMMSIAWMISMMMYRLFSWDSMRIIILYVIMINLVAWMMIQCWPVHGQGYP